MLPSVGALVIPCERVTVTLVTASFLTAQVVVPSVAPPPELSSTLTSTVEGLGLTYVSIPSLTSTVQGLGQTYVSIPSLTSTVEGLGSAGYLSTGGGGGGDVTTAKLISTVEGLGTVGYVSSN